MTTLHRWFESGNYSLLGHADLPEQRGPAGIVIVPPFGWEDVSSYRPLRFLARTLAAQGIPVLRYDLPATGDSSGDLRDSGLVEAWIRSVADAAAELRAVAGVEQVALFGIRLGAMLATAAASRGANAQDLIFWGASRSGRAELREMRAYANLERWEFDSEPPDGSEPGPDFEVGGFLITPEAQRDLESLDPAALPMGSRRVLLLSRDDLSPDANLVRAFESRGCAVTVRPGPGYSAMMAQPHEALPPAVIADAIVRLLAPPPPDKTIWARPGYAVTVIRNGENRAIESVYPVGSMSHSSFGILTEPAAGARRSECCLLFLNAGGVRHTGPNRMWVDAARRYAAKGLVSLRWDLLGIGESDGEPNLDVASLYQEQLVEQVELAIDSLRSRCGLRRFVAIGLCSGAFWAFHAAQRNRDIRAAILLNPRLFFWDPDVDVRRALRRGTKGLVSPSDWWRVIRGGIHLEDIKQAARAALSGSQKTLTGAFSRPQIPAQKLAEAWRAIERNGTRTTLVFTDREPLLLEMENEHRMPDEKNPRVRLVRIGKAGHTFRPRWAQRIVHELIDRDVEAILDEERVPVSFRRA